MIDKGSRWLVCHDLSLNKWDTKWIPRSNSFKLITPMKNELSLMQVANLIDRRVASGDAVGWIMLGIRAN